MIIFGYTISILALLAMFIGPLLADIEKRQREIKKDFPLTHTVLWCMIRLDKVW